MSSSASGYTRRKFMKSVLTLWSGVLAGGMFLANPRRMMAATTPGGSIDIDVSAYEELKNDGGFKVIKEVQIGEITDNIIIVRKSETTYLVFSSICRHKKCNVKYKSDKDAFVCPCHGSTYDIAGKVKKGPSTGDLPAYTAKLSGVTLTVTQE